MYNHLLQHAQLAPERDAFSFKGVSWSWNRFMRQVQHNVVLLRSFSPGDRIAILSHNSPHMLTWCIASHHVGTVVVPLNTRLTTPELLTLLHDARPKLLLADDEHRSRATQLSSEASHEILTWPLEQDPLSSLSRPSAPSVSPGAPAMILYTSGTTGHPKGVVLTLQNILSNATQFTQALHLTKESAQVAAAPMFHVAGLHVLTYPLMLAGGRSHIIPKFSPDAVCEQLHDTQADWFFGVPLMWQRLLEHKLPKSLRQGIAGGDFVTASLRQLAKSKDIGLWVGYGMTETCAMGTLLPPEDAATHPETAIGWPEPALKITTNDDSSLCFQGANVSPGYWRGPEHQPVSIPESEDHTFVSADIGTIDHDRCVHLMGRADDMMITGGENVHPREVERVIERFEGIEDVAVFGIKDTLFGHKISALIWPTDPEDFSLDALETHCRAHLAGFKTPKQWKVVCEDPPRSASGKLERHRLLDLWQQTN